MSRFVVFDCDGTLVDSQHVITAAMAAAFETEGLTTLPAEEVRMVVGLRLDEAIARLAPAASSEQVERLAEAYRQAFVSLRRDEKAREPLYPGIIEALDAIRARGWAVGMATGKSRRGVEAILDLHDMRGYFDNTKSADDGPGKPNPEILEIAIAEIGIPAHHTVVVGDTVFDMNLATNAGASGIGVKWGYHSAGDLLAAGAKAVVADCEQLLAELDRVLK